MAVILVAPEHNLPQYTISTNGTARTPDGSDITPVCAATYVQELTENTNKMALQINQAIGQDLCSETSGLLVASTSVQLVFMDDMVSFKVGLEISDSHEDGVLTKLLTCHNYFHFHNIHNYPII